MPVTAGWHTPMLSVASVEASIAWYARLGFELVDKMGGPGCLGWARMHCQGGAVMFLRNEERTSEHGEDRILFCLYTPDLPALREQLIAAGVTVGAITHPEHAPWGTVGLHDPDGYEVFLNHWNAAEDERWERERRERLAH